MCIRDRDYWPQLDVATYINYEDFLRRNPGANPWMATTKAPRVYTEAAYEPDCYIMFGKESAGIPEELLLENQERAVRIPMVGETRSLNLSNSVAVVLYEALRQNQFPGMKLEGCLLYTSFAPDETPYKEELRRIRRLTPGETHVEALTGEGAALLRGEKAEAGENRGPVYLIFDYEKRSPLTGDCLLYTSSRQSK